MKLLTVKELSVLISVKESTLYSWAGKGLIPAHKLNGLLRFDWQEIEVWIKNSGKEPEAVRIPKAKSVKNNEIDNLIKRTIDSVKAKRYNHS